MPIQIADVKNVLMSRHKMNETGLNVVLDGLNSFFVEKSTGQSTPIKYDNGRHFFDIWAPAPIKASVKQQRNDDDMDFDVINKTKDNKYWVLGADEEEGF